MNGGLHLGFHFGIVAAANAVVKVLSFSLKCHQLAFGSLQECIGILLGVDVLLPHQHRLARIHFAFAGRLSHFGSDRLILRRGIVWSDQVGTAQEIHKGQHERKQWTEVLLGRVQPMLPRWALLIVEVVAFDFTNV